MRCFQIVLESVKILFTEKSSKMFKIINKRMRTFECVLGSRSKKETPPAHGWDCNMITNTGYQCCLTDPSNN